MLRCIVVGRVIPERANVRFGPVAARFEAEDVQGTATTYAEFSQISVRFEFDRQYDNIYNIISIARSLVSPIANYVAFSITASYEVIFDLIVDVDSDKHFPVSVSEPFFDEDTPQAFTFRRRREHEDVAVPLSALGDGFGPRILEELSNALKRPHLTPMYCRLAIETIRTAFDEQDESEGWKKLKNSLNVKRETIDTFWKMAADQRHGRTIHLDWAKRKACLEAAWEIAHRFMLYKANPQITFDPL